MRYGDIVVFVEKWRHVSLGTTGIVMSVRHTPAPPLGIPKTLYEIFVCGQLIDVPKMFIKKI